MTSVYQRRALLTAALGFTRLRWREPVPRVAVLLATWLDSWRGVGAVVTGMTAQGFNVQLKEFPEGWRANFCPVGATCAERRAAAQPALRLTSGRPGTMPACPVRDTRSARPLHPDTSVNTGHASRGTHGATAHVREGA
jgi:hypothetical protein